jgi:uncharacterized protein YjlB
MEVNRDYTLITYTVGPNKRFPNNEFLPVLHYKNVLQLGILFNGWRIRKHFKRNGWSNSWRNTIYDFDHYHSNTHEVMAVIKGKATLILGGDDGQKITIEKGDVLIIPAGVSHRNASPATKCRCIGAYPNGIDYDMRYGTDEGTKALENIKQVKVPDKDPLFGNGGEIRHYW